MKWGKRVLMLRARRGWSRKELADRVGVFVGTVGRWERNQGQPTPYFAARLEILESEDGE